MRSFESQLKAALIQVSNSKVSDCKAETEAYSRSKGVNFAILEAAERREEASELRE